MITDSIDVREDLCISCGGCSVVCPKNCIGFRYNEDGRDIPTIDKQICVNCKLCSKVCPINKCKTIDNLNELESENKDIKYEVNDNCYLGYSKDSKHRYNAATAGVATQIVKDLITTSEIDACLVVEGDNNSYNVYLAKSCEEIDRSIGSKYRPVNLLGKINNFQREISKFNKVAVIGLPCHINSLYSITKYDKVLKEKIVLTIAIFCKQNKDLRFSKYVKNLLKVDDLKIKIKYRGEGWPGRILIKNNEEEHVNSIAFNDIKISSLFATKAFSLNGCFLCADCLGNRADISLGDAWTKKILGQDTVGSEYIICNTVHGKEFLDKCKNIVLSNASYEEIKDSQGSKAIEEKHNLANKFYDYYINDIKNNEISKILSRKKFFESKLGCLILQESPKLMLKILFRVILR